MKALLGPALFLWAFVYLAALAAALPAALVLPPDPVLQAALTLPLFGLLVLWLLPRAARRVFKGRRIGRYLAFATLVASLTLLAVAAGAVWWGSAAPRSAVLGFWIAFAIASAGLSARFFR